MNSQNPPTVTATMMDELSRRLLSLFRDGISKENLIEEIVLLIRHKTGFECVGVRLRDGPDFPYYFTQGFDQDFVEGENNLCVTDAYGEVLRDSSGNPVLECMCGNIIEGRTDPSSPFFTEGGSFWTNSTSELLATYDEEDRQGRTRNRCNKEGYESVALIPIRDDTARQGLLQINDHRVGCFNEDLIRLLEGVAISIGIVFSMRAATRELRLRADDVIRQARSRTLLLGRIADELTALAGAGGIDTRQGERILSKLEQILDELDRLKGILPICSCCKKVRTDSGYWQQVESYVRDRSSADFSHTFCPDCYDEFVRSFSEK